MRRILCIAFCLMQRMRYPPRFLTLQDYETVLRGTEIRIPL